MSNMFILNTLVMIGIVVSAIMAVVFKKLLPSIIALGVTCLFMVFEYMLLHAPDIAIAEAAVGMVVTPIIFIYTLKRIRGGREE